MACYSFNVSIISRGKGGSVVAAAAYSSGEKLHDIYDGRIHNRSYRRDVIHREILLPSEAPCEFQDRQTWLDALNIAEKRADAQMARAIKLALPNELSFDEHVSLTRDFLNRFFVAHGFLADIAIHQGIIDLSSKPDTICAVQEYQNNPHAHILVPLRPVDEGGFQQTKNRCMNSRSYVMKWREEWARIQNQAFERLGLDVRVTHESLAQRGIDREPSIHLGAATIALERKGILTERGDEYRAIIERNRDRELDRRSPWLKRWDRDREMERLR